MAIPFLRPHRHAQSTLCTGTTVFTIAFIYVLPGHVDVSVQVLKSIWTLDIMGYCKGKKEVIRDTFTLITNSLHTSSERLQSTIPLILINRTRMAVSDPNMQEVLVQYGHTLSWPQARQ